MDGKGNRVRFLATGETFPSVLADRKRLIPANLLRKEEFVLTFDDDDSAVGSCSELSDEYGLFRDVDSSFSAPLPRKSVTKLSSGRNGTASSRASSRMSSRTSSRMTERTNLPRITGAVSLTGSQSSLSFPSESIYSRSIARPPFLPSYQELEVIGFAAVKQQPQTAFTHLSSHFMRGQRFGPIPRTPHLAMPELPGVTHPQHLTLQGMPKGVPRSLKELMLVDAERVRLETKRMALRQKQKQLQNVTSGALDDGSSSVVATIGSVCIPTPRALDGDDLSSVFSTTTQQVG